MKALTFWFAVVFGIAMLIACCDDPPSPPKENIEGEYRGWLIFDSLGDAGGMIDSQPCEWSFTRDSFMYVRPDSIADSIPRLYPDCFGSYKLREGLELTALCDLSQGQGPIGWRTFTGRFVILQHTKSNLVFVQGGSSAATKIARLILTSGR